MSAPPLPCDGLEDLQFLIKDDISAPRFDGRIIPRLLSNEAFHLSDLELLSTLNFKVDNAGFVLLGAGNCSGYELSSLIAPDEANTLLIEANSKAQFVAAVRYIFRGSYTFTDPYDKKYDGLPEHDIFRSIRFHVDMIILGEKCQMHNSLTQHARHILSKELDLSCSQPYPPVDLIDTIPYVYDNLVDNNPEWAEISLKEDVINNFVTYCVTTYHSQQLEAREDFYRLITENKDFNLRLRKAATENRVQNGAMLEPLDIPPTNAMVESKRRERQMSLDAGDFWENSDQAEEEHSSDGDHDDDEELPDIEELHINGDEEEAELLEALIVSAPDSLENSVESLHQSPEQPKTPGQPKHVDYEHRMKFVEMDWEIIGDT